MRWDEWWYFGIKVFWVFWVFGILTIDLVSCCSNGHENEWECHWMQLFLYMETAVSLQLFIKHWLMLVLKYFMFMIRSFEMTLFWRFARILGHFLTPIVVEYYIIYMFGFAESTDLNTSFDCVVVNTVHFWWRLDGEKRVHWHGMKRVNLERTYWWQNHVLMKMWNELPVWSCFVCWRKYSDRNPALSWWWT